MVTVAVRAVDDGFGAAVIDAVAVPSGPCGGAIDSQGADAAAVQGHDVAEMLTVMAPPCAPNVVSDSEVEKEHEMLG
jgi:hypothetical protein